MKTSIVLNLVWLAVLGAFLSLSSPAYAEPDPFINQAFDKLHQALHPDAPLSDNDKAAILNSAMDLLKQAPPVYKGQKKQAMKFITAALEQLKAGDPNNKVDDYIRSALGELSKLTNVMS